MEGFLARQDVEHMLQVAKVTSNTNQKVNKTRVKIIEELEVALQKLPDVDVQPVVHSEWLHVDDENALTYLPWYCLKCGKRVGRYRTAFCPNCGADMRNAMR